MLGGESRVMGRYCSIVARPRAVPLPVILSTSHAWATACMNVPAMEMLWPHMYSRKLRPRSERNVPAMDRNCNLL